MAGAERPNEEFSSRLFYNIILINDLDYSNQLFESIILKDYSNRFAIDDSIVPRPGKSKEQDYSDLLYDCTSTDAGANIPSEETTISCEAGKCASQVARCSAYLVGIERRQG